MNQSYSKTELLFTGVRKILVDDNTNTGKDVREIQYYCADRIYRSSLNEKENFPQILMEIEELESNLGLPSSACIFTFKICVNKDATYAFKTADQIGARIEYLLNKKHNDINIAAGTNKNLRCRMFRKVSSLTVTDMLMEMIIKTVIYTVIVDDEYLIN